MIVNERFGPRAVAERLFEIAFGIDLVRGCDSETVEELLLLCASAITVHCGNQREVMRFLWKREVELEVAWERSSELIDDVLYDSESRSYPGKHKVSVAINGRTSVLFEQSGREKLDFKPRLASVNANPLPDRTLRRARLTPVD